MDEPLKLLYWVRGSDFATVDSIETSPDVTVAALARRIIESCGQPPVPNSDLRLFKVPQTCPVIVGDDEHTLGTLSIAHLGSRLGLSQKLTTAFAQRPQEGHLHLILDVTPTLPITCWVRGADSADRFLIKLPRHEYLDVLRDSAKERFPSFHDVAISSFRLYKVLFKNDKEMQRILDRSGEGELIPAKQKVEAALDDIPFSSTGLDIVLEAATPQILSMRKIFIKNNPPGKLFDPVSKSTLRALQPDSSRKVPSVFRASEDRIPITLLHPVFGQFMDDVEDLSLTAEDNNFGQHLTNIMSNVYSNEWERARAIQFVLESYDVHLDLMKTTTAMSEEELSTDGHRCVVFEFKNEAIGLMRFENIGPYYLDLTRSNALKLPNSPLPCLLLSMTGSFMYIAGGAWNLRPSIQMLEPIAFQLHSTNRYGNMRMRRTLAAFRRALKTLNQYYDTLEVPQGLSRTSPPHLFPHPTTYTSLLTGETKNIVYERQFPGTKLVFFAFEGSVDGVRICVKFVRQYSEEAHKHCASLGCAPALRGFERIPGDWLMVVMDDISEGHELLSRRLVSKSVQPLIAQKLADFHEAGFVHGDFRASNIMVSTSDETDFKFLDFDWAGKENKVRYPPYVNQKIWRPTDVGDGLPILAAHDDAMLDHMECWCE